MTASEKIAALSARLTPTRLEKMRRVLNFRTRKILLVLEDVFQPHNAAAALRNCDAFGLQEVHIIENRYRAKISSHVDTGVSKWMDVVRHTSPSARHSRIGMGREKLSAEHLENTRSALSEIKSRGYALAASTLRAEAGRLEDIPSDRPIALMIGSEFDGLSEVAHGMADYYFSVPMLGFAQSFNLSVFSAICLSELSRRVRSSGDSWKLTEKERESLMLKWLEISVGDSLESQ